VDISDLQLALQYWEKRASKCLKKHKKHRTYGNDYLANFYQTKAAMCRVESEQVRAQLEEKEDSAGEVRLANLKFVYDKTGVIAMCDVNEKCLSCLD